MELTPGQQRLLFVVIVIVLAVLGIFLISRNHHTSTAAPAASPTTSAPAAAPTTGAAPGTATGSTSVPPSTVPPAPPPATSASGANIYEWLPFTQSDLTAASKTTLAFANAYVNWSYTESKSAYGAKLAGVTTPAEVATLEYDQFGTSGVSGPMVADKQVSTGSGAIESISSFGASPTSITFSVTITQQLASTTGTKTSAPTYAITTVSVPNGWAVDNIQLSNVGNT